MLNSTPKASTPGRGRPREFDMAVALDGAILVFREKGYNATTVADLKKATALASGSIYKAFADKRAVFLAALDRYVADAEAWRQSLLQGTGSGREKLCRFLDGYVESASGAEGKRGCLVIASAVELATFDEELADRVKNALFRNEGCLSDILRQGQSDGSISADIDAGDGARSILCVLQGMRVLGKTGKTREEMAAVARFALRALI